MTPIQCTFDNMASDDYDQSEQLADYYDNCSQEERAVLDKAWIYLCGYTLATILNKSNDKTSKTHYEKDGMGFVTET